LVNLKKDLIKGLNQLKVLFFMIKSKSLQDLLEGMGLGADETDFKTEMFNLTEIDDPPVKCPDDEMDGTY